MDLSLVSQDGPLAHLKMKGRVTQRQVSVGADPIQDLLGAEAYQRQVLIDMRETEFLDSSGISWLLITHKRFREHGGRLVLYSVPPMVMNVLKVLKMQSVFDLAADHEEALKRVQGDAP